jgi:hypothetical protein
MTCIGHDTVVPATCPARVVELADRHSQDHDVSLFWGRRTGRLWVEVTNRHSGRITPIAATPANALDVFHHSFAYAEGGD